MSLSPCRTCTSTLVWLSATVVNTRLLRVGIVLLRSMRGVNVPSLVSMPSVWGVTSRSTSSLTSPAMMPVWMAAPMAMPSSGFTARFGSLPKTLRTISDDLGRARLPADQQDLVDLLRLEAGVGEAAAAGLDGALEQVVGQRLVLLPGEHGVEVLGPGGVGGDEGQHDLRLLRGRQLALRLLRRFLEPLQGHAVLRAGRCPSRAGTRSISQSMMRWSKSSPPRNVSPPVARTWKRPSAISRIEMSKVPPPRS